MTICSLEGLAAQVTKFVHSLVITAIRVCFRIFYQLKVRRQALLKSRVDQTKCLAMLIALMSVEEHEHTLVGEVALTESLLIHTVNLRVCEDVPDTLQIHDHQVAVSYLPGEVGESLSD